MVDELRRASSTLLPAPALRATCARGCSPEHRSALRACCSRCCRRSISWGRRRRRGATYATRCPRDGPLPLRREGPSLTTAHRRHEARSWACKLRSVSCASSSSTLGVAAAHRTFFGGRRSLRQACQSWLSPPLRSRATSRRASIACRAASSPSPPLLATPRFVS